MVILITDSVYPRLIPNALLTPYSRVFCSRYATCNSIYTWSWAHLQGVERSRQVRLCVPYPNILFFIAVCSARNTLLGTVSLYEAGHTYTYGVENSGSEMWGIRISTYSYTTELSEVRHSYPECATPNIDWNMKAIFWYVEVACFSTHFS